MNYFMRLANMLDGLDPDNVRIENDAATNLLAGMFTEDEAQV